MQKIEYLLKHNKFVQKTYVIVFSLLFRFLGLFIRPDPHRIIFQSMIGKSFGDSPRVLFDRIRNDKRFDGYKFVWAFDDPEKFHVKGAEKVKLNSLSYYIETLRAGIWITNVNIERGLRYKPKSTVYLNTWHGVPVKIIGNSQKTRSDYDYSDVDFMCCSCEFERNIFIRDFKVRKEATVKCGMPRNDELYHIDAKLIDKYRKELNIPADKKVILYAPTWRDSSDGGKSYQISPPIDIDYWQRLLGDEYVMLFRMHHLTTEMMGITFNDFVRDLSDYPEINKLMIVADILISDYSATIFDYSILERPIISFAYDYEEYSQNRGFYENLRDVVCGNVFKTQEDVISHIKNMDNKKEIKKAASIKNRYIDTDGQATEACIDFLVKHIK